MTLFNRWHSKIGAGKNYTFIKQGKETICLIPIPEAKDGKREDGRHAVLVNTIAQLPDTLYEIAAVTDVLDYMEIAGSDDGETILTLPARVERMAHELAKLRGGK